MAAEPTEPDALDALLTRDAAAQAIARDFERRMALREERITQLQEIAIALDEKLTQVEQAAAKRDASVLELNRKVVDGLGNASQVALSAKEFALVTTRQLAARIAEQNAVREFAAGNDTAKAFAEAMQGPWDSSRTYEPGQVVLHGGSSYLVLKQCKGVVPSTKSSTGTGAYYAKIAAVGARGPSGLNGLDLTAATLLTLTDAATVAWNLTNPVAQVTIAGSRTLTVTNLAEAGTYILHVIQGGSGSNTMTWPSNVKWPGDTAPVLTTTAGKRDIFTFTAAGLSGTTYLFGSYALGYPL